MPQHDPYDGAEHRYDETLEPQNPPNSVLRPAVRRTAVWTYVGVIAAVFILVGAALVFWTASDRSLRDDTVEPSAVGTSGERMPRDGAPGGFEPAPKPGSTRSEIEYRGGGEQPQGPMPGLSTPLTRLEAMRDQSPQSLAGRRIELRGVEVERAEGNTFQVRDGGDRATVVAPGTTPTVQAGQRVDVVGTLEQDDTGVRIRASRIDVR